MEEQENAQIITLTQQIYELTAQIHTLTVQVHSAVGGGKQSSSVENG